MTAGRNVRRPIKLRRRGRHKTPSQVEKVAAQAGKAAPAVAIAGALVAGPNAHHAAAAGARATDTVATAAHRLTPAAKTTLDSITARTARVSAARSAMTATHTAGKAITRDTYYKVRAGDTLSAIAQRFYERASDWQWLFHENDTKISDPNLIFVGQTLFVPADPPANYTLPDYQARHARPSAPADASGSDSGHSGSASSASVVTQSASQGSSSGATTASTAGSGLSGTLGCSGLEELWDAAGGNPSDAFMAAEIAMAESGGNQYALSPTDDYGYWQINVSNGPLATFNALGNAHSAIDLSDDGTNWSAWTTYTSGAYVGRC